MEHLDPKHYLCTKPVHVDTYFKEFHKNLNDLHGILNENDDRDVFGIKITEEQLSYLKETCNIDSLKIADDIPQVDDKTQLWNVTTLDYQDTLATMHLQTSKVKQTQEKLTTSIYGLPKERDTSKNSDSYQEDLEPFKDSIYTVRLYKPIGAQKGYPFILRYIHDIALLGSHTLAQLRDKFKCVQDFGATRELESPNEIRLFDVKDQYPSGFIFIEDCFYNDMRQPDSIDYSEVILAWAKKKQIAHYKTAKMEETKISDLKIRIGYPYLYQHQSNCEHILIFTDVRLLRVDEERHSLAYPYSLSVNSFNNVTCVMCRFNYAEFVVTNSDRHIYKYNYMCKSCVLSYDYKDGEKIGSFNLYPHYHLKPHF